MVSVEEACQIIQSVSLELISAQRTIQEATGRILSESIYADRDFPPFNRVAMDGIAIHSSNYKTGNTYLIEDAQAAGAPQKRLQNRNNCIEVMTGAVLPEGTDAVIRYEDVIIQNGSAIINLPIVTSGMNIHFQGTDAKMGDELLAPHQLISPSEIALMASVGKTSVQVFEFPRTAIISSGDELVEISDQPEPHQIRRSNAYALQAALLEMGWNSTAYHLTDDKDKVKKKLKAILKENEVLIISGGVSKGKFDFIPDALAELGIQKRFHQVSQRPGKPFWFGTVQNEKVVFALPGNPVSTFLCFYKYIKPWMRSQMGIKPVPDTAVLASDFHFQPALTYFLQVNGRNKNGVIEAHPLAGGGSGDFVNLNDVNGFLQLPPEKSSFKAGETYPFIPFR
ncbi:MAG: molybdopterin molybdotransferase MoeA [Cyclobacteriaceae bacterium]|nr:molybdopterin molybdotransferase MoeA [Cyclobacteriaceae bacterium]